MFPSPLCVGLGHFFSAIIQHNRGQKRAEVTSELMITVKTEVAGELVLATASTTLTEYF